MKCWKSAVSHCVAKVSCSFRIWWIPFEMSSRLSFEGKWGPARFQRVLCTSASSQHVIPPMSQAIQLHRPSKNAPGRQPPNQLEISHNTLSVVDPNSPRRHSMDTSQFSPTHAANATVVKSQSTIMPLPLDVPSSVSDHLHLPSMTRKKSVSSKERLFSVDSLRRTSSSKSAERSSNPRLSQLSGHGRQDSIKEDEQNSATSLKQTSLAVTTADNVSNHDVEWRRPCKTSNYLFSSRDCIPMSRLFWINSCHVAVSMSIGTVCYRTILVWMVRVAIRVLTDAILMNRMKAIISRNTFVRRRVERVVCWQTLTCPRLLVAMCRAKPSGALPLPMMKQRSLLRVVYRVSFNHPVNKGNPGTRLMGIRSSWAIPWKENLRLVWHHWSFSRRKPSPSICLIQYVQKNLPRHFSLLVVLVALAGRDTRERLCRRHWTADWTQ